MTIKTFSKMLRSVPWVIAAVFFAYETAAAAEEVTDCSRFDGRHLGGYGTEVVEQMHACAEQGHIKAIHKIGEIYLEYDGSDEKVTEALNFYKAALQMGDAAAAGALAKFYYSENNDEKSLENAAYYAKLAYEMKDSGGAYIYAFMQLYGKGVRENVVEGMRIMRELSKEGNREAVNFLNQLEVMAAGKPYVPPEPDWNIPVDVAQPEYPRRAAQKNLCGYAIAEFNLDENGAPYNIRLSESYPDGVFDASALAAAKRLKYKPVNEAAHQESIVSYKFLYIMLGGKANSRRLSCSPASVQ